MWLDHPDNPKPGLVTAVLMLVLLLSMGCRSFHPCSQRHVVSAELRSRFGSGLGAGGGIMAGSIPPGLVLDDGVSSDEAVTLAMWNNAAYHELLAQLGVSRAQLYDAGLIADPQILLAVPVGPKQLEFMAFQAVDALWLRRVRRRAAELDLCELSQQLVQNGLDVIRDVRFAHADLLLAQQRAELTSEAQRLREAIAALAAKRLGAGDISELEATSSRVEALQAEATAAGALQDVRLAQEQLRTLVGIPIAAEDLWAVDFDPRGLLPEGRDQLVAMALALRPDLRAIEIRKAAACRRAQLARRQFMMLDALFDVNSRGTKGLEAGPGLRMTLPLFNGNKGGVAIADALVRQVDSQYATVRDQIELEVRTAVTQLEQAWQQRELVEERILPALAEAAELSQRNYEDGGVPYFLVLQTTGQYVDAQLRRVEATASIRRAYAELERSVGQKLRDFEGESPPVAAERQGRNQSRSGSA